MASVAHDVDALRRSVATQAATTAQVRPGSSAMAAQVRLALGGWWRAQGWGEHASSQPAARSGSG